MKSKKIFGSIFAGGAAGAINGLFGAGGGMVLVPILTRYTNLEEDQVFPSSVSIILPICIISICANIKNSGLPLQESWPYLTGGIIGGLLAGFLGHYIPVKYLHRILGLLILWGGIRYLC
ncbi:MAG: TSUP family transporter [Oscillospiraceae bacterium]|nr:TSUP family transporter [Oscillospiraceae bacterium]